MDYCVKIPMLIANINDECFLGVDFFLKVKLGKYL